MHRPPLLPFAALTLVLIALVACSRASEPAVRPRELDGGARLVYAEHGNGTTTFWAARPEEPADRRWLASVEHDREWGVRAALSPDGRRLAYTAMPPGARDPDTGAVLTVLDLDGRDGRRLATGLDLRTTPLWLGDSGRLIVQRRGPLGSGVLVEVAADGAERAVLAAEPGHRLFAVGSSTDGTRLFVADTGDGGTRLRAVGADRRVTDLGAIAAGPARGYVLAPDQRSLAFLRLEDLDGERRYRAHVLDLATGRVRPLRPERMRLEDTGVTWSTDGFIVTATSASGAGLILAATPAGDLERQAGFDAATTAQANGQWLPVRAFADGTPAAPGVETLQLVRDDGRRTTVQTGGATAIGWSGG